MGAGGRCLAPRVGVVPWGSCSRPVARAGAVCGWACGRLVGQVSSSYAGFGTRGRLSWFGVLWVFQDCYSGGHFGYSAAAAWGKGGLWKWWKCS